jgi:hypothetical protein
MRQRAALVAAILLLPLLAGCTEAGVWEWSAGGDAVVGEDGSVTGDGAFAARRKPTATPDPPTETPAPTATDTPAPTPTETPAPTATATPEPTATETPVPAPTATDPPEPTATATTEPTPTATPAPVGCDAFPHLRRVDVASANGLDAALAAALPGDLIVLADATYADTFTVTRDGTQADRIVLCGGPGAVLGPTGLSGNVLRLNGATDWTFAGFTIRGGNIGVFAEFIHRVEFRDLDVGHVGQSGVVIRYDSTFNTVADSHIHHTGLNNPVIGEGVYVGTYHGGTQPPDGQDNTADTLVTGNYFGPYVGAEAVDVKQRTVRTTITGNWFDGTGSVPAVGGAGPGGSNVRAWLDIQGSDSVVTGNVGVNPPFGDAVTHGVFVYAPSSVPGSGSRNVFRGNDFAVNGSGYGFKIGGANAATNVVGCDNAVTGAGSGFSDRPCTP